VPWGRLSL